MRSKGSKSCVALEVTSKSKSEKKKEKKKRKKTGGSYDVPATPTSVKPSLSTSLQATEEEATLTQSQSFDCLNEPGTASSQPKGEGRYSLPKKVPSAITWNMSNFMLSFRNVFKSVKRKEQELIDAVDRLSPEDEFRVRRASRNARFHTSRGVTPGLDHAGGGPDMQALDDADEGHDDELIALFMTRPAFRYQDKMYPDLPIPIAKLVPTPGEARRHQGAQVPGMHDDVKELKFQAMKEAAASFHERKSRALQKQEKRRKNKQCAKRFPMCCKKFSLIFCLFYCAVMIWLTLTYVVKFDQAAKADEKADLLLELYSNATQQVVENGKTYVLMPVAEAMAQGYLGVNATAGLLPNQTVPVNLPEFDRNVTNSTVEYASSASKFIVISTMGLGVEIALYQPLGVFIRTAMMIYCVAFSQTMQAVYALAEL